MAQGIQNIRNAEPPPTIRSATGKLQSAALASLLRNFGPKCARRMAQFTYGFPLVGSLSQNGVYSRSQEVLPTPPVGRIWAKSSELFDDRANQSGYPNSRELWGDAPKQVELGWLGAPLSIDIPGNALTYERGSAEIAFLCLAGQADRLRARDDIKRNPVNRYFSVWTPVKLRTRGHIAQMCLEIKSDLRRWSFFKAGAMLRINNFRWALCIVT